MMRQFKIIIFDFDGTLINSMPVKYENFSSTLTKEIMNSDSRYEDSFNLKIIVKEKYIELSGMPRKRIFGEILNYLKIPLTQVNYEKFNSNLSELNQKTIDNNSIFPDAMNILNYCNEKNLPVFISSSVPQKELTYLAGTILDKYEIKEIMGSDQGFSKGKDHIQYLIGKYHYTKKDILFVGDNNSDYVLGTDAGVFTLVVDREGKADGFCENCIIKNLNEIKSLVA